VSERVFLDGAVHAQSHKESGALRTTTGNGGRPVAAFLLCGAVLVMPLLLLRNGPSASASPGGSAPTPRSAPSAAPAPVPPWKLASDTRSSAASTTTSTTTTVPPTTTEPPATTDPPPPDPTQDVAAHLAPARAVPPPTTAAPVAASGAVHYGQVTFYDHPAGTCASPYLPFGTEVRVTNPATGASVTCLVNDREADTARSIDLATATFAEIAPLSQGVIDAQLVW
jgi:rare lipoprotein A